MSSQSINVEFAESKLDIEIPPEELIQLEAQISVIPPDQITLLNEIRSDSESARDVSEKYSEDSRHSANDAAHSETNACQYMDTTGEYKDATIEVFKQTQGLHDQTSDLHSQTAVLHSDTSDLHDSTDRLHDLTSDLADNADASASAAQNSRIGSERARDLSVEAQLAAEQAEEKSTESADASATSADAAKVSENMALAHQQSAGEYLDQTENLYTQTSDLRQQTQVLHDKTSVLADESYDSASESENSANISVSASEASEASASSAKTAETNSKSSEVASEENRQASADSAAAALVSETNSKKSETESEKSRQASDDSAGESAASALDSAGSAASSETSSKNSKASADDSADSAAEALASEQNSKSSENESKASQIAASESELKSAQSAEQSELSSKASATSAIQASAFADDSQTSAQAGYESEVAAKLSETNSKASETASAASASSAADSAKKSADSAELSEQSQLAAKASETNSKNSENSAAESSQAAAGSEQSALASEKQADEHQASAETSNQSSIAAKDQSVAAKNQSVTAQKASESARDLAEKWSSNPENEPVSGDDYSALHWSAVAKRYADSITNGMYFAGGWNLADGFPPEPDDNRVPWYRLQGTDTAAVSPASSALDKLAKNGNKGDQLIWDIIKKEWFVIDTSDKVLSVNGQIGDIELKAADVGAVNRSGDIITGDLSIRKTSAPRITIGSEATTTYASLNLSNSSGSTEISRRSASSFAVYHRNTDNDTVAGISLEPGKLRVWSNGSYKDAYHPDNKPTPAEIGALSTNSSKLYAHSDKGYVFDIRGLTSGGWARSFGRFETGNNKDNRACFGMLGSGESANSFCMGEGDWWSSDCWFAVDKDGAYVGRAGSGHKIYHKNNKPTAADVGARPVSYVPAWSEITSKPSSYPPATHDHNSSYAPLSAINYLRIGSTSYYYSYIILLVPDSTRNHHAYTRGEVHGDFAMTRGGSTGSSLRDAILHVDCGNAYREISHSIYITGGRYWDNTRMCRVVHEGVPWLALDVRHNVQSSNIYFRGYWRSDDAVKANQLKIIQYYRSSSHSSGEQIIDQEIYDSVTEIATQMPMSVGGIPLRTIDSVNGKEGEVVLSASDVGARPSSYVPAWSEVTGKPSQATRWPTHDEVTGKPSSYPPSTHSHSWSSVTDKPSSFPPSTHAHSWTSVTDKPSTFPPSTHTHSYLPLSGGIIDGDFISKGKGGADLNDLGTGIISISTTANTGSNTAITYNTVLQWGNAINRKAQLVANYDSADNRLFFRKMHDSTRNWKTWCEVYTTDKKPTAADVGARSTSWNPAWNDVSSKPSQATRWPAWSEVTSKPSTFPPASHNHDDDYAAKSHSHSSYVPTSRTVNGKALTGNITLSAADVKARADTWNPGWNDVSSKPSQATRWPTYSEVTDKPSSFPPASHNHDSVYSKLDHTHDGSATKSKALSSSIDLNDLFGAAHAGIYHQTANANTTGNNYPTNNAGSLMVLNAAGTIQVYRVYNKSDTYTRARYRTEDSWTPWRQTYDTANKPTADDVSAIPNTTERLSSTVNIDDLYKENGIYEVTQNNMDDPPHPGSWDATLLVLAGPHQADQLLCPGDGNLFHRVDDSNPTTGKEWREWRKIYNSRNPPTAAEVGAEPILAADQKRKITISTSDPSGGSDGDIWFKV